MRRVTVTMPRRPACLAPKAFIRLTRRSITIYFAYYKNESGGEQDGAHSLNCVVATTTKAASASSRTTAANMDTPRRRSSFFGRYVLEFFSRLTGFSNVEMISEIVLTVVSATSLASFRSIDSLDVKTGSDKISLPYS